MAGNLIYTVALDYAGETGHRNMAKMLVSSLLRTRFTGEIVVFHNSPAPLFMVAREGVREVALDVPETAFAGGDLAGYARSAKHAAAAHIEAAGYAKIMFIDCDSVVLRNIDHLLAGECDLACTAEAGTRIQEIAYSGYLTAKERRALKREGFNSGTWAVTGARFGDFIERWRAVEAGKPVRIDGFREQSAFNRVVLDWEGVRHEWPHSEIALPLCNHAHAGYRGYMRAAVVHAAGGDGVNYKLRFLFSAYAATFLYDTQLTLLNIMEM